MPLGGMISLLALAPNVMWAFLPSHDTPARSPAPAGRVARVLALVEPVGRVAVFATPFFYSIGPLHATEGAAAALMIVTLGIYYACWVRYFVQGRAFRLLYQPLWGMPIPMAIFPTLYFGAASVVLHASWLAGATVLLAVSHIPLTYDHGRRLAARRLDLQTVKGRATAGERMHGRVCIVTGANSGLGKATAIALAARGASVVLVCRDRARGERAREEIVRAAGNPNVELEVADLSAQRAIRALAASIAAKHQAVHVLVHAAGATFFERAVSADGIEMNLAVNVLAPFLLTTLLLPQLRAGAPSRVVTLTGRYSAKRAAEFNDIEMPFDPGLAAYQSSTAKVLLTAEFARRFSAMAVFANCVYPGAVRTALQHKLPWYYRLMAYPLLPFFQSPAQGARGPVLLATAAELTGVSGRYFEGTCELLVLPDVLETDATRRLWDRAENMTAMRDNRVNAAAAHTKISAA